MPPFMIMSITNRCNLKCSGCYARALRNDRRQPAEMDFDRMRTIVAQAEELGIGIILVAGGEPLLRSEVLDLCASFPRIVFLLFTNGLLIDDRVAARFRRAGNVIPIISIEGKALPTDTRRGAGTFQAALRAMARLRSRGVFFGSSITVTAGNYREVTETDFVRAARRAGCRHFIYVEYVPVESGTEPLALDTLMREDLAKRIAHLRLTVKALFTAFPGGEEELGGCLAAGRGFVHISPAGDVEACPFAPVSDSSLSRLSLEEGLRSPLLRAIREADGALHDTSGGCALWANRDRVAEIARSSESLRSRDAVTLS